MHTSRTTLKSILQKYTAGDFNQHSHQWSYQFHNRNGTLSEELTEATKLSIIQGADSVPTHRVHLSLHLT